MARREEINLTNSMEKKEEQVIYKLSAFYTTNENIEIACQKRFQRITMDYILVYDEEIPDGATEITAQEISALSLADREWLDGCIIEILEEIEKEHEESKKRSFQNFFKELEQNIKDELNISEENDEDEQKRKCATE